MTQPAYYNETDAVCAGVLRRRIRLSETTCAECVEVAAA